MELSLVIAIKDWIISPLSRLADMFVGLVANGGENNSKDSRIAISWRSGDEGLRGTKDVGCY